MAKKIFFFLTSLFFGLLLQAQEKIDPERPDQSESADLLAQNYFQAEFGFNKDNNSGRDYDLLYPTALFKYGLKRIELRLETVLRSSYEQLIPNPEWHSGLDPISMGFKVNLAKEKGLFPKTSFITGFGIPIFATKNFRTDHIAPSLKLAMNNSISDHADLSYNLGAEWDGISSTPDWLYSVSQDFNFAEDWNVYFEVFGFLRKNESPQNSIDTGIGYCISNDTKVDFSCGLGISQKAPKSYIAIGFSFRLKPSKKK